MRNTILYTLYILTIISALFNICCTRDTDEKKILPELTMAESVILYNDSIITLDKGKEIIAYKEKYDHQRLINEQQQLKLEKAQTQRMLFIITFCLVIVIAILVYLYQKRLVKKENTIRIQSEQLKEYMLQLHENESKFMQNLQYIDELKEQICNHDNDTEERSIQKEQIESLQTENTQLSERIQNLQTTIGKYTSLLDDAQKDIERFRNISEESLKLKERERVLTDYLIDNNKLISELKKKSHLLSDNDWEKLEELCNSVWNGFSEKLLSVCPQLTEQEVRLCLLIKLRFNNTQMAAIYGVSPASISQKKFRLKKHLCETMQDSFSDEMTLERWLDELWKSICRDSKFYPPPIKKLVIKQIVQTTKPVK